LILENTRLILKSDLPNAITLPRFLLQILVVPGIFSGNASIKYQHFSQHDSSAFPSLTSKTKFTTVQITIL